MHVHDGIMKLIFGLVMFGSLAAIVAGADSVFPFSNYPMYSKVFVPDSVMIQHSVVVETHDGQVKPLSAGEELRPFWGASFREALFVENDPAGRLRRMVGRRKNGTSVFGKHAVAVEKMSISQDMLECLGPLLPIDNAYRVGFLSGRERVSGFSWMSLNHMWG